MESLRIIPDDWLNPLPLGTIFDPARPLEIDLGCGKGRFLLARAQHHPEVQFFGIDRMLRRICEDGSNKLVGGTVQYGAVVGTDFAIFGSRDYEIDEDAENSDVIRVRYFASGVALSRVSKVIDSKGIVPRYKYVSLFEGDIMNLERKGYRVEYE